MPAQPSSLRELGAGACGDLRLWLVDLREPDDPGAAVSMLAHDEIERMTSFRFEADRVRYRRSHSALRQVLAHELGVEPAALRYAPAAAGGKPRLTWPAASPLDFNLSHCRDYALIGLSTSADVGVDIETPPAWSADDLLQTARGVLSAAELLDLQAMAERARRGALMRAWTRKEACLKAIGVGLAIEPRLVEVGVGAEPRRVTLVDTGGQQRTAQLVQLHGIAGCDFFAAAACVARDAIHDRRRQPTSTRG